MKNKQTNKQALETTDWSVEKEVDLKQAVDRSIKQLLDKSGQADQKRSEIEAYVLQAAKLKEVIQLAIEQFLKNSSQANQARETNPHKLKAIIQLATKQFLNKSSQ